MELVRSLEKSLADLYKGAPHLPVRVREWIVDNVWWLVIISLVLSILSIFSTLQALSVMSAVSGMYSSYYGMMPRYSSTWLWLALLMTLVQVALLAMAIGPLKAKAGRGWRILFILSLVSVLFSLINMVFLGFFSVIGTLIGAAIGWYFLFEIRDGFMHVSTAKKPAAAAKKDAADK